MEKKLEDYNLKIETRNNVFNLISEIENKINSFSNDTINEVFNKEVIFAYQESFNYTNKGKNGGFTWHDVIYLQRRFIFGKIKLKLKWACVFRKQYFDKNDIRCYNKNNDIFSFDLKSIQKLEDFLIYYKKSLNNLNVNSIQ